MSRRALVVGGSLAGLFAAVLLRAAGWNVDVYERSAHELDSRGGGIVLQPQVLEAFQQAGIRYDSSIGVVARERVFLDEQGRIADHIAMRQVLTSWTSLYGAMRRHLPAASYHQGAELESFVDDGLDVTVRFVNGQEETGQVLIAADGAGSAIRRHLLPDVEAEYAGYIAWRGLVNEPDLPPEAASLLAERFAFFDGPCSQFLVYLVPGERDAVDPGRRRFNWVWYRTADGVAKATLLVDRAGRQRSGSIPPGWLAANAELDLREAADQRLPPPLRQMVSATRQPFLQIIQDLTVPRMAFGRVALIGDAAFVPRPHTAASTSKAAGNALALAAALQGSEDVSTALLRWEPEQLRAGQELRQLGQRLGERFKHKMVAGDTPRHA